MRRRILAANWKMNHGPTATTGFMRDFAAGYTERPDRDVVLFPPAVSIAAARAGSRRPDGTPLAGVALGVQNIHWEDRGAFTGAISGPMARDAGADYVLVGHSERRQLFGETDEQCAAKCAAAERAGLTPVLCLGETLAQRERDETAWVVVGQLRAGLSALTQQELTTSVIAYEPVWAIGTGRTATPADASEIHRILRSALRDLIGDRAEDVSILYGGSATAANAADLLRAPDVDGLLVGGASLTAASWLSICAA